MSHGELRREIESLASMRDPPAANVRGAVDRLLEALERGEVRAAERGTDGWQPVAWVKRGILLGFRHSADRESSVDGVFYFRDRESFPTQDPATRGRGVRVVPGGTTIRRGAYLGQGVVVMPPAYVNVGAWVGAGAMIDSHVLVGSCAQIGERVHLSAAAQIGGVLEPVGAAPVVVEDDAFVGGGSGIYEGTCVSAGAVIAPGVILTRATPVHDLARERVLRAEDERGLVIPEGAVVVPGSRPAAGEFAAHHGLQLQTPVIVKYRDGSTDAALELEEALR